MHMRKSFATDYVTSLPGEKRRDSAQIVELCEFWGAQSVPISTQRGELSERFPRSQSSAEFETDEIFLESESQYAPCRIR